ncbi:MAG: RNA 2',3'-cyclic phosphodiesterase [Methanosarcinaceae archaeon]|nr:RNA 2',3'-cyclic phosphodiesterase [Methanosarcinaceae archaeon]
MIRTFVAFDFPPEFKEKIVEIQLKLNDFNLKLVDPDIVHITLKFLGDVDEHRIEQIARALDGIVSPSFDAVVRNVGVFPKPQYIKVIWLGAEGSFAQLHDNVESALDPLRFKKDKHGYTAHATIARVKSVPTNRKGALLKILDDLKDVELGTIHVDTIKLKKSTLTPEGPIYETLHKVRLK